ncbi:hypothetical protein EI555_017614, partial [Monodon monoceros]
WDDSSSVSSGLSDTLDNISTDDLNTASSVSSYSNATAPSRKNMQLKTDSEKRSATDEPWDSTEEVKKTEEDFDSHGDGGKTDDAKASEKGKTPLKGSTLQRSPSDAGKSSGDEGKKPPSGIGRSTATGSFGFKKPSGVGSSAMITSSGATITSGSATLGKIPKSAAIGGKSNAGRKTSLDGSQNQDDVVLHVSSKTSLQYRSLPRPSKSSTSGIPGRGGHRSSTSSIDSNVSSKSAGATTSKLREPTKIASGRSSPVTVNQTDKEKEKVAVSDSESVSLSGSPKSSPTSASACGTQGLRQPGSKYPDIASPTFRSHHGSLSGLTTGTHEVQSLLMRTGSVRSTLSESMMRSNSIPAQDSSFDLYDDSQLCGSATSLEERPRAISHSGSFRDSMEEVHGSSLSLVSSTSSLYSTAEEKAHSEAHLVAAFEKSLGNMTGRLQSLTMTAEQKESELIELRETIEMLKAQNSAAQAAIQGALNGPDHPPKDLRIRRQHSSESVSSINSATSHSSIGSGNDADSKKKKKKNWLRSSFKQAFGKKKSTKPPSSHSDIEELTDSSLPASPKLPHNAGDCGSASMKPSQSASAICECTEAEAEIILQLKSELREKELKLTDIRLEALSSAHHLDQIREAMNRMQNEIEILKAENDRLKAETGNAAKPARPPSESASSTSSSSSRQSLGLSLNNLNITESVTSDILLDDAGDATGHKDGRSVKIIVSISKGYGRAKDQKSQAYLIGSIGVSGKTKWDVLDGVIRRLFKEYVFRIDTSTSLGLSSDCIASYCIGDLIRSHNLEVPELLPCGYLVGDNNIITVNLKGVEENSLDSFVFDTLIPKPITQRYFNLLMEHHRIILSGPSGTGKTYLANKLAEYVITKSGRKKTEDAIATFNVDHKSSKELQQYLANLAEQCSADNNGVELPVVIILDNLHHVGSLSDIFNGFLNCKYNKCPYIIGTMNQGVSSSPNLELHHNFRWVLCANHTEPVKGFLGRYLRRKLIEMEIERNIRNNDLVKIIDWIPKTWHHLNSFLETHSSSDVTIGPRLFLPCPMDVEGSRVWFMDLWNYSLVPYILEAVREGLQMYGKRAPWEDPSKWVLDTYPWSSASLPQEGPALLQLRPEDVGYEGCISTKEATTSKHIPQTDTEGDPLMNMLMKLQEAANYSGTQSCDSDSTSHHEDVLDSSLESTL